MHWASFLVTACFCIGLADAKKENKEKQSVKTRQGRFVVTDVLERGSRIFGMQTSFTKEDGTVHNIGGVVGISYNNGMFYAVSRGMDGEAPGMYTLDFDLTSFPAIENSVKFKEMGGVAWNLRPSGALHRNGMLLVPTDDTFVSIFDADGNKVSDLMEIGGNFDKAGDGITSLTMASSGSAMWTSTLVGELGDGPKNIRISKVNETSQSIDDEQFLYILSSDYPEYFYTSSPSESPSSQPSLSGSPSHQPTTTPSVSPSMQPTTTPSSQPSDSGSPSLAPSNTPSDGPSMSPSFQPSNSPSATHSDGPSSQPSISPSGFPSTLPSEIPSSKPSQSAFPSTEPSAAPSVTPSAHPSLNPSKIDLSDLEGITMPPAWSEEAGGRKLFENSEQIYTGLFDANAYELTASVSGPAFQTATEATVETVATAETTKPLPRNGLVSLVAVDAFGDFLALERIESYDYFGRTRFRYMLFYVDTSEALSCAGLDLRKVDNREDIAAKKTLLLDFDRLIGMDANSYQWESMTLVPSETSGIMNLVLISDDDFQLGAQTKVMTLSLQGKSIGVAKAQTETEEFIGEGEATVMELEGKAESAKIWVHPSDPSKSVLLAAHGAGLTLFDLQGRVVYDFLGNSPYESYGSAYYTDIDIIYSFPTSENQLVDLAVLADSQQEKLNFRLISQFTSQGELEDITGFSDYSLGNADIVVGYTSPLTGQYYVLVGDKGRDQIVQLELYYSSDGLIDSYFVRTISLPPGQLSAMTVDKDTGYLYIAIGSDIGGIFKFDAEPETSNPEAMTVVMAFADTDIETPFSDLTIYYAGGYDGYLLASHPTDSTYAAYERTGDNFYVGSFEIASLDDQNVATSEGISALNVNLGPEFSCGVMVVQDSMNAKHRIKIDDGKAYNVNTNFKFVRMEEVLLQGLPNGPGPDTYSWGPRRLALAIVVDTIAQELYAEMFYGSLTPRMGQELLGHLGAAAYELYRPGSQMRQMMSPAGGTRPYGQYRRLSQADATPEISSNDQRHLKEEKKKKKKKESNIFRTTTIPRCEGDSNGDQLGTYTTASNELKEFVWKVGELIGEQISWNQFEYLGGSSDLDPDMGKRWMLRIQSVVWALPTDMNYF